MLMAEVRAVGAAAEHDLGHDADAEHDEDEGAEELRGRLARRAPQHGRDYRLSCRESGARRAGAFEPRPTRPNLELPSQSPRSL